MAAMDVESTEVVPYEGGATHTWVVMEAKVGSRYVWAWCQADSNPGFRSVYYTEPDGVTVADLEDAPSKLDRLLFSVTVPA
jgi:hypothetical protein